MTILASLSTCGVLSVIPVASADRNGYINILDAAGVIDHDGNLCNMIDGLCHGQFTDAAHALTTGDWVCRQIDKGRSRGALVYELSHGEGLMPSSYNAPIIVDAAISEIC